MSQATHTNSTLTFGNVKEILGLARKGVYDRYIDSEYSYVYTALRRLFYLGILECSNNRGNPVQILHECLQDERAVLDHHNRLQAKILFRQETIHDLSENLENLPLRRLVLQQDIMLPNGFKPVYQVADDPENLQAAHNARMNAAAAVARLNALSINSSADPARKQYNDKPGNNHDKLYDTPSPEHDFPDGNITLAEIAAFIPQSIKCWDIIDRIIWNGAKTEDITHLINKYRVMPAGKIVNNTVYMMMRGQMYKRSKQDADYEGWTVGAHQDIAKPDDFDPHSISVTDFRRPRVFANRPDEPADPIPFKDLANGVAVWPEHGDALDLTRCVSWCAANPKEQYYYPTDFQKVLYECLGGPVAVEHHHEDAQVLSRLRSVTGTTKPRNRVTKKSSDDDTDVGEDKAVVHSGKRKRSTLVKENVGRRKIISTQVPRLRSTRASRKSTNHTTPRKSSFSFGNVASEDETDDDVYQGPKRAKKNKAAPRRSERAKKLVKYDDGAIMIDDDEEEMEEEYKEEEGQQNGDTEDYEGFDDEKDDEMDEDEP